MVLVRGIGLDEGAVRELSKGVRGPVLQPGDDGYARLRRVWNGRIDRYPALIVRCAGVADVRWTVQFARRHDLPLSVRSTGHNVTGSAVCEGGLMLDLSLMKGLRVDPVRCTARAEAGLTWGEFDHETTAFGLATTGGRISTTGIAGVTLGGGYGWLMRKYGLAIDNLLAVDLVTAEGEWLTASATQNADLFWGVRGGGGNFGIVTSFEYQLHAIGPRVTGGMIFYPATHLEELLYCYREFMAAAPDDLAALFNVLYAPPAPFIPPDLRGTLVAAIAVCHVGSLDDARSDLAPLRDFAPPLLDRIQPMPYTRLQRLYDAAGQFGHQVYGCSGHLADLGDAVINTLVTHVVHLTSPLSIVMLSPLGGAVARVGEFDTAFSHRHTAYDYAIDSVWTHAAESDRHMEWTREFGVAMRPFTCGVYVNELGAEGAEAVRRAYHPITYDRLVALKNRYDPTNVFSLNQNIQPSV